MWNLSFCPVCRKFEFSGKCIFKFNFWLFWKRLFRFGSLYCIFGNTDHNWQQIRSPHYLEAKSHTIVLTISSAVLQHYAVSRKNGIQNKITQQSWGAKTKHHTLLFRLQNIFTWMWSPVDSFPKLHNYTSAIELLFILGFSCGKTASKSQCAYIQVCVYHALWAELVGN